MDAECHRKCHRGCLGQAQGTVGDQSDIASHEVRTLRGAERDDSVLKETDLSRENGWIHQTPTNVRVRLRGIAWLHLVARVRDVDWLLAAVV